MEIAYVAHTASSTLLLDGNGICVRVEYRGRALTTDAAERCVGAQYMASLDPSVPGGLAPRPTVGVPMVFAAMGLTTGRIYLVRTGPLVAFEEVPHQVAPSEYDDEHDTDLNTTPWHKAKTKTRPLYVPPQSPESEPFTRRQTENVVHVDTRYAVGSSGLRNGNGFHGHRSSMNPPPPPPPRSSTPPPRRSTIPPPPPYASYRPTRPYPPPIPITHVPTPAASSEPTLLRRRPPAPSSHAWLRGSPAALLVRVK